MKFQFSQSKGHLKTQRHLLFIQTGEVPVKKTRKQICADYYAKKILSNNNG